jgi:hypothetical protein
MVPTPIDRPTHPPKEETMPSLPPLSPDAEAPPSPSDETRRLWMTRRLLRSAVRSYELTLAFSREVDASLPGAFKPPWNKQAEPEAEREAWWRLRHDADSAFYAAEVALAERIVNLYDFLAPVGKRIGPEVDDAEYQERGVTLDGRTFIVLYDPAQYEPGDVLISMTPIEHVVGLDD